MDADSLQAYSKIKGTFTDEKGEYDLIEITSQTPCNCHPETCPHTNGLTWTRNEYKKYKIKVVD